MGWKWEMDFYLLPEQTRELEGVTGDRPGPAGAARRPLMGAWVPSGRRGGGLVLQRSMGGAGGAWGVAGAGHPSSAISMACLL